MDTPHARTNRPAADVASTAGVLRAAAIVLALVAAVILMLYYGSRLNQQEDDRRLSEGRQRDLIAIREGRADETFIYDPELFAMIVADPDAAASATSLVFSHVDFSDSRFAEIDRLERLQNLGVSSSTNVESLLTNISGMPSIRKMWIEKTPVPDSAIGLLATLPNLKQIRFAQAMSAEQVDLLESTLPGVNIDVP